MRAALVLVFLAGTAFSLEEEIDRSTTLPAGVHRRFTPLRIVADGIIVDLGDAVLVGSPKGASPDRFKGIGLLIEGRRNIVVRGGRLRGFRCAILIKDCENVLLEGIDVSGNFRQRLKSTPEREDPTDWLRPHDNDKQEWRRRYGAGICLERSYHCVVRKCVGRKQQNGILLDRCRECEVHDNDFSFNSGWGIALWRSSKNTIAHNKCDWCVRGYSHGVYDRGQDSAGILVFEQCNENKIIYNSATHGGDGFFLFAGNETLRRTGKGGCNKNVVLRNDFSHAVANAIEATFSAGNHFAENRCNDSNYGIWAGYSYDTLIIRNTIAGNRVAGVAIEHGANTAIRHNRFSGNPRGVWLWWDDDKDLLASKFGRTHPCRSESYVLANNTFDSGKVAVFLQDTSKVKGIANHFRGAGEILKTEGRCDDIRLAKSDTPKTDPIPPLDGRAYLPTDHPRGRKFIMVDEWGPLDPLARAVFPRRVVAWDTCTFFVLGPDAAYDVEGLPDGLTVEKDKGAFRVRGAGPGITRFAGRVKMGAKTFPIEGILLRAAWRVRFWKWEKDPREDAAAWKAMVASPPLVDEERATLDFSWQHGAPSEKVPADRFATRAETTMKLARGRYEVRTVSDDGVRVFIDGKKVLENWTWHGPTENKATVELEAGEHSIVVEHFEIDGWAVLQLDLRPLP